MPADVTPSQALSNSLGFLSLWQVEGGMPGSGDASASVRAVTTETTPATSVSGAGPSGSQGCHHSTWASYFEEGDQCRSAAGVGRGCEGSRVTCSVQSCPLEQAVLTCVLCSSSHACVF